MDQSRRQILKVIAGAPLLLTFGFAGEALMRFAKPTMKPFGFFDPADRPTSALKVAFRLSDFQEPWTCIPFLLQTKITEFSPEQQEIRKIPGFAIRLPGDEIVAYSRICPGGDGCILNYVANSQNNICGCVPAADCRCCAADAVHPVLMCPSDLSVFHLAKDGRVSCGTGPRRPRRFELDRQGDTIAVVSLEGSIQ